MLYIIVGPSGSGKTTLSGYLRDAGASEIVSTTTRPIRDGEIDGVHYHFVSNEKFDEIKQEGKFLEDVVFGSNRYGVEKHSVDTALVNGYNEIAVIVTEIHGYLAIRDSELYDTIGIFLNVDKETASYRLHQRGDMKEATLKSRLNLLDEELLNIKHFMDNRSLVISPISMQASQSIAKILIEYGDISMSHKKDEIAFLRNKIAPYSLNRQTGLNLD